MKVLRKLGRKLTRFFSGHRSARTPRARLFAAPIFRGAEATTADANDSEAANAGLLPAILLPTSGRSGSTLTMQLLATSPHIALEREYPYEARYLTYFLRMSRLPLLSQHPDAVWNGETMLWAPRPDAKTYLGPPHWTSRALLQTGHAEISFDECCFRALWREFSATVTSGKDIRHYAEKTTWLGLAGFRGAIPTRLLCLLRDPRDVWISVRQFDAQRGFYGFGRGVDESEADFLERFLDNEAENLRILQGLREDDRTLIVRYERLVGDLPTESRRIGDWLGVTLDPHAVESKRASFAHHMTSDGKAASIARWKRELPPEINRRFVYRIGDFLRHFDFETT